LPIPMDCQGGPPQSVQKSHCIFCQQHDWPFLLPHALFSDFHSPWMVQNTFCKYYMCLAECLHSISLDVGRHGYTVERGSCESYDVTQNDQSWQPCGLIVLFFFLQWIQYFPAHKTHLDFFVRNIRKKIMMYVF
jgi:hypothetical protein